MAFSSQSTPSATPKGSMDSSKSNTPFTHKSLDNKTYDFRLLTVLPVKPGNGDELVSCELHRCLLQDAPSYNALSYVWDPTKTSDSSNPCECNKSPRSPTSKLCEILVNGQVMEVGLNVEAALRKFRGSKQWIWIDALCINQKDDKEKSHQVKRMTRIYSQAAKVMVWLGEDTYSYIWQLYRELSGFNDSPQGGRLNALRRLFQNPFWRRVWIIQEVSKGSKVIILGKEEVPWDVMIKLVLHAQDPGLASILSSSGIRDTMSSLEEFRASKGHSSQQLRLLEAVVKTNAFSATIALDKIYAILGVTSDGPELVQPDYDLSCRTVYQNLTKALIEDKRHKEVSFILLANRSSCKIPAFPCWLPNYASVDRNLPPWILNSIQHRYRLRSPFKDPPRMESDNVIQISGTIMDTVVSLSCCLGSEDGLEPRYGVVQDSSNLRSAKFDKYSWRMDQGYGGTVGHRKYSPATAPSDKIWDAFTLTENDFIPGNYLENRDLPYKPPTQDFRLQVADDKASLNRAAFAVLAVQGWSYESPKQKIVDQWLSANEDYCIGGLRIREWGEEILSHSYGTPLLDGPCWTVGEPPDERGETTWSALKRNKEGHFSILEQHLSPLQIMSNYPRMDARAMVTSVLKGINTIHMLVTHKMRLITTAQGQVMWAYREIQRGDKICILENCICVVLRPRPEGDGFWYVGEAIDVPTYSLANGPIHYNSDCEHQDKGHGDKILGVMSKLLPDINLKRSKLKPEKKRAMLRIW